MPRKLSIVAGIAFAALVAVSFGLSGITWAVSYTDSISPAETEHRTDRSTPGSLGLEVFKGEAFAAKAPEIDSSAQQYHTYIRQAEDQQKSGEYIKAEKSLRQALLLAQEMEDGLKIAMTLSALGNVHIALGPPQTAQKLLNKAEALSRELNQPALTATVLINLGNFYAFQNNYQAATKSFEESIRHSKQAQSKVLSAQAQTNVARIAVEKQDEREAEILLGEALKTVDQLKESQQKNHMLINLAKSYMMLAERSPQPRNHQRIAYNLLIDANAAFEHLNEVKGVSYALGFLGELYETEGRYPEALELTQRAIFNAQKIDSKYLLFRWLWQKARVFFALKDINAALDAQRQAVSLLSNLRYQMAIAYEAPGTSFRESVAPVYSQLIDLLLKKAKTTGDRKQREKLLVEIRDTVEQLKVAKIRDYFRDECVDALKAKDKPAWETSSTALIVYPILLNDRTELLLDFPDGKIKRLPVSIGLMELTQTIHEFRALLEKRTTNEYRTPGQRLYHWLIEPIKNELISAQIDTLVFVPDGALLTVPLSALYDGKQHLIEQYAVAITPSVQLTDPQRLAPDQIRPLLGGLSEPVEGFPALVYVKDELREIQQLYGGELLLDRNFRQPQLKRSLNDEKLNVLHISTHGVLGRTVDESYLLTFDGRLSISRLAEYVGMFKFRQTPLELLVLSACETAQGDERAALGLSGIAVKSGARSAVGTLWKVNDAAASLLMQEFYRQLKEPQISRAKALKKAQLSLLKGLSYRHPGYWSPFILINNWL